MSTQHTTQDLVITRTIDTPVAEVWRAWTDSDTLKQWWGPQGFTCPLAQMDVREGGASLVGMSSSEHGEHYSLWQYQQIVPNTLLEFIHDLADKSGNILDPVAIGMPSDFPKHQRQTVAFRAIGANQTEITITEYVWTTGQMMEMSRMGMEQCLDKMATIFA